jgi:Rps23 Pro-64 3,4-dihydroxylase Tpa1-like proline 4-hydroxylase
MLNNSFNKEGYAIIDDFLPLNIANDLYDIFNFEIENNWELIDQVRAGHYSHVFKTINTLLPNKNEKYSAKFSRSEVIENSINFKKIINDKFKAKFRELFADSLCDFDTRAYKLNKGDYYRTHIDSYAGQINLIYYVNINWIWDWGGVLHVCSKSDEDYCKPIFPKFNRAVFLNNKKFHSPHFVSQVSNFALDPRYSVVIFAS